MDKGGGEGVGQPQVDLQILVKIQGGTGPDVRSGQRYRLGLVHVVDSKSKQEKRMIFIAKNI